MKMPDLQTELKAKVIPNLDSLTFDDDEPDTMSTPTTEPKNANPFTTTNGVTQATLNLIRDNPGKYRRGEAAAVLETLGYKPNSTSSIITQNIRKGKIGRDHNGMLVLLDAKPVKRKVRSDKGKSRAYTPSAAAPAAATPLNIDINSLPLSEARALYDELKKVFGG
jgi:hypothetical protein